VTWSVDDCDDELLGFELPESDVDCDTTLTLVLKLIENPCILERTLTNFVGLLFIIFEGTLVDTSALVD
jgi:hypothetical protein